MKNYPIVLSLAGSDCTGEAGIQSDMKTISGLGAYAATVITSIAVYNKHGIKTIHGIPPNIVRDQIEFVMENMFPDVVKIGLVNDAESARMIADCLRKYHPSYVVFDPVMLTQEKGNFPDENTINVIKNELLHHIHLMTINLAEAEVYTSMKIATKNDVREAARLLAERYRIPVLLKGSNLLEDATYDAIHIPDGENWEYIGKKIVINNMHNASLIFSASIATLLAYGLKLNEAIKKARQYVEKVVEKSADTPLVKCKELKDDPIPDVEMSLYE